MLTIWPLDEPDAEQAKRDDCFIRRYLGNSGCAIAWAGLLAERIS